MFKVLIAEDEPLIRKGIIYCTDWARLNCGIPLEASNGEEAAEMIRQHRPDIVLLDVNMPLMDGLDALLSTVQMPSGMPVATVAIDGAANAALLAAQILAVEDAELTAKLRAMRQKQHDAVVEKDRKLVID